MLVSWVNREALGRGYRHWEGGCRLQDTGGLISLSLALLVKIWLAQNWSHAQHRQKLDHTAVKKKNTLRLELKGTKPQRIEEQAAQLTGDVFHNLSHVGRVSEGGRHCNAALPQDRPQQVCFRSGQCFFFCNDNKEMKAGSIESLCRRKMQQEVVYSCEAKQQM